MLSALLLLRRPSLGTAASPTALMSSFAVLHGLLVSSYREGDSLTTFEAPISEGSIAALVGKPSVQRPHLAPVFGSCGTPAPVKSAGLCPEYASDCFLFLRAKSYFLNLLFNALSASFMLSWPRSRGTDNAAVLCGS
jgi:hypothetical protein